MYFCVKEFEVGVNDGIFSVSGRLTANQKMKPKVADKEAFIET